MGYICKGHRRSGVRQSCPRRGAFHVQSEPHGFTGFWFQARLPVPHTCHHLVSPSPQPRRGALVCKMRKPRHGSAWETGSRPVSCDLPIPALFCRGPGGRGTFSKRNSHTAATQTPGLALAVQRCLRSSREGEDTARENLGGFQCSKPFRTFVYVSLSFLSRLPTPWASVFPSPLTHDSPSLLFPLACPGPGSKDCFQPLGPGTCIQGPRRSPRKHRILPWKCVGSAYFVPSYLFLVDFVPDVRGWTYNKKPRQTWPPPSRSLHSMYS